MNKIFVIADLHLSFGVDKPMDIFGTAWTDHATRLRENWNSVVDDGDVVIVPGDLSWALHENEVVPDLRFIDELNGQKILMKGNHELWWGSLTKLRQLRAKYGFSSIHFLYNNAFYIADRDIIVCGTRFWKCPGDEGAPQPDDEKIFQRELIRFGISLDTGRALRKNYLLGNLGQTEYVLFGDNLSDDEKTKMLEKEPEIVPFFHYPPRNKMREPNELTDKMHEIGVKRVYFGHIHGAGRVKSDENGSIMPLYIRDDISYYLTSADHLELTPRQILM